MSFWGVEVLPGKPVIHRFSKARGKLHISQATVSSDIGDKSYNIHCQCNVMENTPIFLCAFDTTYQRSCRIDLEFGEEDGDIVLSVIGSGNFGVHLTGYYIGDASLNNPDAVEKKKTEETIAADNLGKNKIVQKMRRINFAMFFKIFLVLAIFGGILSKFESSHEVQPKVCKCWM